MAKFDRWPRALRDLANIYDMPIVEACLDAGVENVYDIRGYAKENEAALRKQSEEEYRKPVRLR